MQFLWSSSFRIGRAGSRGGNTPFSHQWRSGLAHGLFPQHSGVMLKNMTATNVSFVIHRWCLVLHPAFLGFRAITCCGLESKVLSCAYRWHGPNTQKFDAIVATLKFSTWDGSNFPKKVFDPPSDPQKKNWSGNVIPCPAVQDLA